MNRRHFLIKVTARVSKHSWFGEASFYFPGIIVMASIAASHAYTYQAPSRELEIKSEQFIDAVLSRMASSSGEYRFSQASFLVCRFSDGDSPHRHVVSSRVMNTMY